MWLCSRVNTGFGLDWRALGRSMTSQQLSEWMAFRNLFPFGDDWLQAATIASVSSASGYKNVIPVEKLIPRAERKKDSESVLNSFISAVMVHGNIEK